jgi:hypothetical protein
MVRNILGALFAAFAIGMVAEKALFESPASMEVWRKCTLEAHGLFWQEQRAACIRDSRR